MCFCLTTLQARVLCSPLAYLIFNKSRMLLFLTQTLPEYKIQVTPSFQYQIDLSWLPGGRGRGDCFSIFIATRHTKDIFVQYLCGRFQCYVAAINPFQANFPFLYPRKLLKTRGFMTFSGGVKWNIGLKWVNEA